MFYHLRYLFIAIFCFTISLMSLQGCSSSATDTSDASDNTDNTDDADTGATALDTEVLAARMESSASALLPNVTVAAQGNLTPFVKKVTYNTETDWDLYTSEENVVYLEDIFGNDLTGPVTQVRVLVDQFANNLDNLFTTDPDLDCTNASELTSSEDTLTVAFFGALDNGTADNRFFKCFAEFEGSTIVYGLDDDNVLRIVLMSDDTSENTDQAETRGDQQRLMQVVYTIYSEATEDDVSVAYLDLQYSQASVYNGIDDSFDTDDDMLFKSRSRIAGRITLDTDGNPDEATGEFYVTKFDQGLNESDEVYTLTTKTAGRGSYASGSNFLFNIDSDVDAFAAIPGVFCLTMPEDETTIPETDTTTDCTTLESDFAWGAVTFPFDLDPTINQDFDDVAFFDETTDLIENDGSNFTIPTYE